MIDKEKPGARRRGRPRSFDRDEALDRAVLVFWEKGYEGASIEDLRQAMNINPPSLYAAFGSKRELFLAAIDRYANTFGSRPFGAFCLEPDVRDAVAKLFETSINCATQKGLPRGCMIASVATVEASRDSEVRDKVAGIFALTEQAIAKHIGEAQANGPSLCIDDPKTLANMVVSVVHSIATRARSGADPSELSKLADNFIDVFFPRPA